MQHRSAILLALVPLAAGLSLARADDFSVFDLGPLSPRMDRLSDAYVKNSAFCNAVAIPSVNTGVPYRLFRLRVTGLGPITIVAEPDGSTPRFDPFLALHCSPNGLGTNNPTLDLIAADDDSGGYPRARLVTGVNLPNALFVRDYYLFVSSYSSRTDRRSGRVRLTVQGPATLIGCPGDLNSDDQVDDADFSIFAKSYNILDCSDPAMPANCPADINADGFVDDVDFQIFAAAYDALICP